MTSSPIAELDAFLASDEADLGMTPHARQLVRFEKHRRI